MTKFIKNNIQESKLYHLQNPNVNVISIIKVIKNPTKQQVNNLLNEDKYHILRGFLTENDLYCWRSYQLTHQAAQDELLKQQGLDLTPLCGIAFNSKSIQLANSWNKHIISQEDKRKILQHPQLQYLFGDNYNVIDL